MVKAERRWVLLWAVAIVGLSCLPYLLAWRLAPANVRYTGLLINHFDGESYYAKMQQGARGDWLFHLAFTPEPHDGAFIFTFYLALGHLARILGLSIPLTYHLARALAGLFLLLVAYRLIARVFDRVPTRRMAFLLLGFSAGFGWLSASFGVITADLWVAEGLTFLSIFANPHFPLAIGLMLLLFLMVLTGSGHVGTSEVHAATAGAEARSAPSAFPVRWGGRALGAAGLGLLLAMVQPFAVPVALVVLAVYLAALAGRDRRLPWPGLLVAVAAAAGAAPLMLYDLYISRTNPALAAWSAQNLTPSLPPWNYALGYGLVLVLALGGIAVAARCRQPLFLLSWVGSAAVLLYVPFALQRRFITGLHVPLALLAALAVEQLLWPRVRPRRRGTVTAALVAFTALTNLFVPLVAVAGVARGQPPLVMSRGEAAACAWLHQHTAWTDTVLAPAQVGQFIPAWAGNRVVYGHPFETIEAETKLAQVTRFYSAAATPAERRALLDRYGVRYLVVTAPESGLDATALGLSPAWMGEGVIVYRVEDGP